MTPPESEPLKAAAAPTPRRLKSRAVVAAALLSFGLGAVAAFSMTATNKDKSSLAENPICAGCSACYVNGACKEQFRVQEVCDYISGV